MGYVSFREGKTTLRIEMCLFRSYYLDQESPLLHVIQIHPLQPLVVPG